MFADHSPPLPGYNKGVGVGHDIRSSTNRRRFLVVVLCLIRRMSGETRPRGDVSSRLDAGPLSSRVADGIGYQRRNAAVGVEKQKIKTIS